MVGTASADQVLRISKEDGEKKREEVLRTLFTKLMSASKVVISDAVAKLISRLYIKREVLFRVISLLFLTYVCIFLKVVNSSFKDMPVTSFPILSGSLCCDLYFHMASLLLVFHLNL